MVGRLKQLLVCLEGIGYTNPVVVALSVYWQGLQLQEAREEKNGANVIKFLSSNNLVGLQSLNRIPQLLTSDSQYQLRSALINL